MINWISVDDVLYQWNGQEIVCKTGVGYSTNLADHQLDGLEITDHNGNVTGQLFVDFAADTIAYEPFDETHTQHKTADVKYLAKCDRITQILQKTNPWSQRHNLWNVENAVSLLGLFVAKKKTIQKHIHLHDAFVGSRDMGHRVLDQKRIRATIASTDRDSSLGVAIAK